jgi:RNA polymerase sigma-70 factor (ECF subfamily)
MSILPDTFGDLDAGLVAALRRDDPEGAEQLVERYGDRVYRLALRIIGVPEDAAEAAEEALRTVADTIETFPGASAFGSWIDRTAATAAYQKLRRRRPPVREIVLEDVVPSLDGDGRHFAPMTDWSKRLDEQGLPRGRRGLLVEAIDALPADGRTALVLHDLEGASHAEIAEILGVGVPAVMPLVHYARLFVRKRLSEYLESGS